MNYSATNMPPSRRFRFGLRTMIVLVTAVAVLAFAYIQYRSEPPNDGIWPGMTLLSETTVIHIKSWKRGDGVHALVGCLTNKDPKIRAQAADWLGAIGSPAGSALPQLRNSLMDPDADVRTSAASAIKQIEAD